MSEQNIDDLWEPLNEYVDALTPESVGDWMVLTKGSTHIWEVGADDAIHWTRFPGRTAAWFDDDVTRVRLTRVDRWPQVGKSSLLWFDDVNHPVFVEQWRRSSTILSIQRVTRRICDE